MNIRTKLTLIFTSIVLVLLTAISFSVYFLSANFREQDFHRRLKNRAINTAKVLVEVEEINAELLRRMEQNNPASLPNQSIVIYNYKNEILYSTDSPSKIPIDTTLLNNIRLKKDLKFIYNDFEVLGFMFTSKYDRYTIVAAATDIYGLDALLFLRNTLIANFIVATFLASLLGWFFAGRVLKPISKIVNDVDEISELNLNRRLDDGGKQDEFGRLAATFNRMLERLQSAFGSQKHFIANASHEIKTPITVMAGEIEVTLLQDRDKHYYVKKFESVLQGLRSLNKLSTQLLVLAQTNAEQPLNNITAIRIDDILWEAKDELSNLHVDYNVEIELTLDANHESLSIQGDEQLLKVAIMNLMDNGCKYSEDRAVTVRVLPQPRNIVIDFVNTGPGIQSDRLEAVFEPFFRASSDKKIKGFGIGLSLVKRIVKLHRGEIIVESKPHFETVFRLQLPTADT